MLQPHDDVATGNFHASEFAADLYKVASGAKDQSADYADPVEFFARTYLKKGCGISSAERSAGSVATTMHRR